MNFEVTVIFDSKVRREVVLKIEKLDELIDTAVSPGRGGGGF